MRGQTESGRLAMFLNDVSVNTSPRNVHAAVAAVRHFGKLPIEDHPLESFQMSEIEPFGSFLKRYRSSGFSIT